MAAPVLQAASPSKAQLQLVPDSATGSPKVAKVRTSLPAFDADEYELRKRLPPRLPTRKNDVYVTRRTNFKAQLERCQKLLDCGKYEDVWVHGLGAAVSRAINLTLQIKRRALGSLDLSTHTSSVEVTDDLLPLLDDMDVQTRVRYLSAVHIRVFRSVVPSVDY